MPSDQQSIRPDHPPLHHTRPRPEDIATNPFTPPPAEPAPLRIAKPEEAETGGDSWAALRSGVLVLAAAAVVAWVFYILLR